MKKIIWENLSAIEQNKILKRTEQTTNKNLIEKSQAIISEVRERGDAALYEFTEKFDDIALEEFFVSQDELNYANKMVSPEAKRAIEKAAENIRVFHQQQYLETIKVTISPGVICERQIRPIARVGLYIPGGTAPLPSTVLMLGIPAQIANNPVRVLCTPPKKNGAIDPNILWAAMQCDIRTIFKIGGAQAIAAMAYGTVTIPKVDKIFGPGNSWVTQAKLLVAQDPQGAAIDMPAGPSELMIIADKEANPDFVASDLLSQAEHGIDSQVILISDSENFTNQVMLIVESRLSNLPRYKIIKTSLANSLYIVVKKLEQAIDIANIYAPEHLSIQTMDPEQFVQDISTAGSVFLGAWSPEVVGDYASGANHVLPTNGYARNYSGLSTLDFLRQMTIQRVSQEGFKNLSETMMTLADLEGLNAHKQAIRVRLDGESA